MIALSLLLAANLNLAQLTKKTEPGTCVTDLDCALLGDCVNAQCVCDAGYKGPNCQYFDLIPAKDPNIEGFVNDLYPAWGGKTIYSNSKYHFIASYMRGQCDVFGNYGTQSAFLRATGNHPLGPFEFSEEILPPFHHGAQIERAPNGEYVVFGDGRNMPQSTVKTNCKGGFYRSLRAAANLTEDGEDEEDDGLDASGKPKRATGGLYPWGNSPNDVHIAATANTMEGPWTQHTLEGLSTNVANPTLWSCNKTNLAPLILKNNTVIMGFRSKACVETSKCGNNCQKIGIAVSHTGVRGPYTIRQKIDALDANEDPFLYSNKRGYFMIMHGKTTCGPSQADINTCGSLGYSPDTYTWYMSPFAAYTGLIEFDQAATGKTSETLFFRHRPKMLMSNEGGPLVLYTSGQRKGYAYTRNFAMAFNVPEMRNYRAPPVCPPKPFKNTCTTFTRRETMVYNRTELNCQMFAEANGCNFCKNLGLCMPGRGDERICQAASPESFYKHC